MPEGGIKPPVRPMLARPSGPFDSEDYVFELKWDGTRCVAFLDRKKGLRLQNRRLRDITWRYPELQGAEKALKAASAVLDGELVVLHGGRPSFRRLQQREQTADPVKVDILSRRLPATYVAFDVLALEGGSLMEEPLVERRKVLEALLPLGESFIISEAYARGAELYRLALKRGFEGVMAKKKDSPYLAGERSGYWLKIKKTNEVDAVVAGYLEGRGARQATLGSLVLGLYRGGRLTYIGRVGSGLDEAALRGLRERLDALRLKESPFEETPRLARGVRWARPETVATVAFLEWSRDRRLRAPVFKRVRDDKPPLECVMEE